MKWEYRIAPIRPSRSSEGDPGGEEVLNNFGKEGWELVSVIPRAPTSIGDDRTLLAVLMRPIGGSD